MNVILKLKTSLLINLLCEIYVAARKCQPEESVCNTFQCCAPNMYCGVNSGECESCFLHEATREANLQTCWKIKNVSDVALRLRHRSCVGACLYTFGDKLYGSYSKNVSKGADNETVQQKIAFSDDNMQALWGSLIVGSFVFGIVVCLIYMELRKRFHNRRQPKVSDVETANPASDGGPTASIDMKNKAFLKIKNAERERLLENPCEGRLDSEINLQHHDRSGVEPEPAAAASETHQLEGRQLMQHPATQMTADSQDAANQITPGSDTYHSQPLPGMRQTELAANSNGRIANVVTSPTTDNSNDNSEVYPS